jgi:hypothetical protein
VKFVNVDCTPPLDVGGVMRETDEDGNMATFTVVEPSWARCVITDPSGLVLEEGVVRVSPQFGAWVAAPADPVSE